jgi:hypothetical protein
MDAVKSDLEGQCDTELRLVQAVLGILPASAIQPWSTMECACRQDTEHGCDNACS